MKNKKFFNIFFEIIIEVILNVENFIKNNLVTFANVLNLLAPYIMYFVGQYVMLDRGYLAVGGEICIPIFLIVIIYFLKSTANKLGKGFTIPLPNKRFTTVDDDGEVTIKTERLQELILYMADLEDWMEKKGVL